MSNELATAAESVGFAPPAQISVQTQGALSVEAVRAMQEVQGAIVSAKKFPRDEFSAVNRIMKACQRKTLADGSLYAYPRGGEVVSGPSIRMAEVLAQNWGNLDFGIRELEQKDGESIVESYCWDLETNVRQTKVFTVPHERHTKKGVQTLKDPRDIYELVANQGARRLRACILGIIPGDVTEAAVKECKKTIEGGTSEPIDDRIRKMVVMFSEVGVPQEALEKRLGHPIKVTVASELTDLAIIFKTIKDNQQGREAFFDLGGMKVNEDLNERFSAKKGAAKAAKTEPRFNADGNPIGEGEAEG
jgi:hypothetical protein